MRRTVRPVGVLLALAAASGVWLAAQPAVDSHHLALLRARSPVGLSVAISVAEPGLYRIDRATLEGAGFAVHDIDPRRLHLSLHGEPVAMHVTGEADGRLDADDTLLFYGTAFRGRRLASLFRDAMVRTGPVDNWLWQCQGECRLEGVFEKYTTTSRYRLEVLETPGLRMSSQPLGDPERASVPRESVRETALHDTAQFWWSFAPRSEDTWFSDWISGRFVRPVDGGPGAPIERTYTVDVPSPDAQGDDATIRAMFASVASAPGTPDYHVAVTFNGHVLGTVTWDGRRAADGTWQVPAAILLDGANTVTVQVLPQLENGRQIAVTSPDLYLDWVEVSYDRHLRTDGRRQLLVPVEAGHTRPMRIAGFDGAVPEVYDLRDPLRPVRLLDATARPSVEDRELIVPMPTDARRDILITAPDQLRSPDSVSLDQPVQLPDRGDYIIVASREFHAALAPLVRHREQQGRAVAVIDPADLYRAFTYGVPHPVAIKSFLVHAFTTWSNRPSHLLLVGSGHWNLLGSPKYPAPRVWMPPNLALADPWQGEVDSANLLVTLVGNDALPDVAVGRLPASTPDEVATYVAKVITYEASSIGDWTRRMVWLADNVPDPGGDFEGTVRMAAERVGASRPDLTVTAVTLNEGQCREAGSPQCRAVTDGLLQELGGPGAAILGFAGHASTDYWAHERVLALQDVDRLSVAPRWPFVLSLTCLDGYWVHPQRESLVRRLVMSPQGAIAAFSPTGLGLTFGHDLLLEGFLAALLAGEREVGALALSAKQRLAAHGTRPDLLHTYTVFGDPALRLAVPLSRDASWPQPLSMSMPRR